MLVLRLALRTIMRRKGRMVLIGSLVAFGTFLSVFGTAFSSSAGEASRASIIDNFTGDLIVYSARSKELPSPFAFNTPLPNIRNADEVGRFLSASPEVLTWASFAQNYGLVQVERDGRKVDLPFIFYAVEPGPYRKVFPNVDVKDGSFFGIREDGALSPPGTGVTGDGSTGDRARGVMISAFQNGQYLRNYGVQLRVGERVTLLGITEGGANALPSRVTGIFEPKHYKSVFNYINFVDAATYSELYNYTGVTALPEALNAGLAAAQGGEDAIFGLADAGIGELDLGSLRSEALSGFTMIAVKLKDHATVDRFIAAIEATDGLEVKAARWDAASGFYASISKALQAFIWLATGLVFLVVALIFANTLIINVVERTAEIGTMRAIGSDKSFVRNMFLAETLILNLAAALVGMVAAGVVMAALSGGVPLPETISQFLIGGGRLPLRANAWHFVQTLVAVAVVSVLATLYPVRVATSITPLKAMSER
ncbi:MAG: FtsX-like permease family protein [Spirochaetes bacterium]|nr:FtsX-like permease family protein [Spirochaetota bacterium]